MPRDDEKLLRQLSLVSFLLDRHRAVTAREIRQMTEGYASMTDQAFARRFYDDREDLRRSGIVVESIASDDDGEVYFLPEENYLLPDLSFTASETRALSVVLALLNGRFAYARPLRLALAGLTRGGTGLPAQDDDQMAVELAPDEEAQQWGDLLAQLDDAVVRGKTVVFPYCTAANVEGPRTVDPYGLARISGHWYVVGRDHGHDAIRTFRFSRITGPVRFAGKKPHDFTPPPDFDPADYRARPPWLIGAERGIAHVRVDEELAWWVTRSYPSVEVEQGDPSGSAVFRTPYADGDALVSWAIGLGGRVEIMTPDELRAALVAALRTLRDTHATPAAALPRGAPPEHDPSHPPAVTRSGPIRPERLSRMLALLSYLMDPEKGDRVPLADVQRDLALSSAEIKADLSLLNLVNHGGGTYLLYAEIDGDVVAVDREPGGEAMAGPARLSPLTARSLLLALKVAGGALPLDVQNDLLSIRTKVEVSIGGATVPGHVEMGDLVPADSHIVATLNRALRDRSVVRLEYYTPAREQLSTRMVEPGLLFHSGNAWYLEAYCQQAGARRTFRLDLIRSADTTDETFAERPAAEPLPDRPVATRATPSRTHWAWVRFPSDRGRLLEEQGFEIVREDSCVRARIPYFDDRWLVREVMRHRGAAELLEPTAARKSIVAAAEDLIARYTTTPPTLQREDT